jgi:predicted transcriptional regulator
LEYSPADIGALVRETRKKLDVTQENLALASGTGLRFIIEPEKGKKTCQIGLDRAAYARHQTHADAT